MMVLLAQQPPADQTAVTEPDAGADPVSEVLGMIERWQPALMTLLTIIVLWGLYLIVTRIVRRYLYARAHRVENAQNFLLLWRYVWLALIAIFALVSFSGSIASLGLSAAFLGMILGWSLQAPVTGLAAWLMIILKRPFKIGDRIIISGIIGDVVDINLTHILLNQVGGTVGGEEKSGRAVLIPNAILFQQIIYNYSLQEGEAPISAEYILDEVPVMVPFYADHAEAEQILVAAARRVTADIIRVTNIDPFTRSELTDWGVRMRLRYKTMAKERQRISSEIVRIVLREFATNPRVEFCYPHQQILYQPKPGLAVPGNGSPAPTASKGA
jgi:small-conductance mechanosensitive channel